MASRSRRLAASVTRRTNSTFSSDIAHAVSRGVGEGADARTARSGNRRLVGCARRETIW